MHDKNISIRLVTAEDTALLCGWWNDGRVMSHAGFPNGIHTTEEAVMRLILQKSQKERYILSVDNKPVGEMCADMLPNDIAAIGIKICDASKQNQGIGPIALSLLIHDLFQKGMVKIVLDTNLKNTRAQHVYEKLGFEKLEVKMNAWQNQVGEWESVVYYRLLPSQFRSVLRDDSI